jgi:hypothetical protein
MMEPSDQDQHSHTPREPGRWTRLWPKVKTPVQLIAGPLISWVLHKWLG